MNRLTTLTLQYYRLLLFNNLLFTISSTTVMCFGNRKYFLLLAFIGKLIGFGGAVAHNAYMYNKSFYYYRNAGLSIRRMYLQSFSIDLCFYVLFFIAYTIIAHAATYLKG